MSVLAINGGNKIRKKLFPRYNSITEDEIQAVHNVMKSGLLSQYIGAWCDDFYGGKKVQEFEKAWSEKFNIKHAVSVNSNTSGLIAAVGACGIGLGDEVIVSPYSMAISATAPLFYNATPVFCDLDTNSYSFDIAMLKRVITKETKAIIVVHIFGCPSNMNEIMTVAKEHNLRVIEDCAQVPGAIYHNQNIGSIGDIGVFSLNYHKHIHTGEGGMCVTNNDNLANKLQLIRNHAESVVESKGDTDLNNMLGYNFRLTEIQAAIGIEQLKKLNAEITLRQEYAKLYDEALTQFDFITTTILENRTHCYYGQAFQFHSSKAGISRERFLDAVKAELMPVSGREKEGVPIGGGYVKPLYLIPLFQKKLAYNKSGISFKKTVHYEKGLCPNVENLHYHTLFVHDFTRSPLSIDDVNDVIKAYVKVCENIHELQE